MENASKALLIAGGVLIGTLVLLLMVTLFASASSLTKEYDQQKQAEIIQKFNSNFTKYLGKDLTIHEVVTICNFADIKNNKIKQVIIENGKGKDAIAVDLEEANDKYESSYKSGKYKVEVLYEITDIEYENGYVSKIVFGNRQIKATEITNDRK